MADFYRIDRGRGGERLHRSPLFEDLPRRRGPLFVLFRIVPHGNDGLAVDNVVDLLFTRFSG